MSMHLTIGGVTTDRATKGEKMDATTIRITDDVVVNDHGPRLQRGLRGIVEGLSPTDDQVLVDLEPNRAGLYGGSYWFGRDELTVRPGHGGNEDDRAQPRGC